MSGDLEKALADLIIESLNTATAAKEFVVAQAPDVVQQALLWYFWKNLFIGLLGLFLFVLVIAGFVWLYNRNKETYKKYGIDDKACVGSVLVGIFLVLIIPFLKMMSFLLTSFQIMIAPKIFLIDYASTLIK
jgi:asparagine N-glycosylation enzyme membrane subunit Stt3